MSEITDEWLAGFFDGEGHVSTRTANKNRKMRPQINVECGITQGDRTILDRIALRFPTGSVRNKTGAKTSLGFKPENPCHALRFSGRGAIPFLEAILPYVIVKRLQVECALEIAKSLITPRGRKCTVSEVVIARRVELSKTITMKNNERNLEVAS